MPPAPKTRKTRSRVGEMLLKLNLKKDSEFSVPAKDAMAARMFALQELKLVLCGQRDWNDPSKYNFTVTGRAKR